MLTVQNYGIGLFCIMVDKSFLKQPAGGASVASKGSIKNNSWASGDWSLPLQCSEICS
jgi:hypothetical protein